MNELFEFEVFVALAVWASIYDECRQPRQTKITVEFEALFWSYKYLPLIAEKRLLLTLFKAYSLFMIYKMCSLV